MKRAATATPGISPAVTPVDPKPTKPSSGVKAAGKLLKSSPPPIDKSKAVERRPAPNAGANVETGTPKETRLIEPQAVVAPAVRPTVGSPPPAPKQRFVREPRPVPMEIPPILLEPDHVPTEPAIAGPGARFALTPPMEHARAGAPEELPESYGTEQILLAARDPYCLFASWDLDAKQQARYNAASASGAERVR